jgi:hypothetical protein
MNDLTSLMFCFESLGDNCEFGLVQRHHGAEPIGLMRWTRCTLRPLLQALDERFAAMGDPDRLIVRPSGQEYVVTDTSYNFTYHPHQQISDLDENELRERERVRIAFMRQKLLDDLSAAEKIFVFKENAYLARGAARRLFRKLRSFGPNRLLYVVPTADASLIGTVQMIEEGLIRGHIEGFGHYHTLPDGVRFDTWARLCESARLFLD